MGKVVSVELECDAVNCGKIGSADEEFFEVDLRLTSTENPGVTKGNGVLCENHFNILDNTLRDNFGIVLK